MNRRTEMGTVRFARDVMSNDVETIIPDIPVPAAVMIMLDKKVDRLAIQRAKPAPQRPVGLLLLSDVIRDMAGEA